ncbi:MAG: helix-turn-helix domain-containing protein [Clostridia bacterium]|nr:helix-turn-helix domain-containing protein [Clostridia bacterium]
MKYRTRLAAKEFRDGLDIHVRRTKNYHACSLHGHDFYELDIVILGSIPTTVNGDKQIANLGTVFFLTPDDMHEYPSNTSCDILNIQFTEGAVSTDILQTLTDLGKGRFELGESDLDLIMTIAATMQRIQRGGSENQRMMRNLLETILLLLYSYTEGELKRPSASHGKKQGMQRAVIYINAHFKDNPTMREVAELLSFNEKYFCTEFRKYTGLSFKNYLRSKKLSYARRLLLSTDISMLQVAEQSGYATQSHFNREFRAYYGISPSDMRNRVFGK